MSQRRPRTGHYCNRRAKEKRAPDPPTFQPLLVRRTSSSAPAAAAGSTKSSRYSSACDAHHSHGQHPTWSANARTRRAFARIDFASRSHLSIALAIKACQQGHRVAFATAQQWVDRLEAAQHRNALDAELRRLERYELPVVDEIGYLPLERQAANLLFALVARRYERGSIIVTSNRGFEAWARSSATRWSPPR